MYRSMDGSVNSLEGQKVQRRREEYRYGQHIDVWIMIFLFGVSVRTCAFKSLSLHVI